MEELALRALFAACCALPFVAAARWARRHAAAWWFAALVGASVGAAADPLGVGSRHLDGELLRSFCVV